MSRLAYSRRHASAGMLAKLRAGCHVDLDAAGESWRALSEHLARDAERITGRLAVSVACAPGAGQGHPGFWMPALAHIGLEGDLLPVAPDLLDVRLRAHHERLCVLRGVFLHEVGHADHTAARGPREPRPMADARATLEEIRMEARVFDQRPDDSQWIRCAALKLNVADPAVTAVGASLHAAATLATLTEGRVLAGTLTLDDVAALSPLLDEAIGEAVREPLRLLWADVVQIADDDEQAMTDAAARYLELVGAEDSSTELDDELMQALLDALTESADETQSQGASGLDSGELLDEALGRDSDRALALLAAGGSEHGEDRDEPGCSEVTWEHRAPTQSERHARARMAATLRRARHRDRDVTVLACEGPPGKLRMREAMRADAQRSAGQMVTARPWRAKRRRVVPAPRLRFGCLVDTSGSMISYVDAISSALWTLNGAVYDTEGVACAVTFGDEARLVVPAGAAAPRQVFQFQAPGATELVADALQIADSELRLGEPGPRMLALITDGHFVDRAQHAAADRTLTRLRAQGVKVMLIGVGADPAMHPCDYVCVIDDAADLAAEVERFAEQMLKGA